MRRAIPAWFEWTRPIKSQECITWYDVFIGIFELQYHLFEDHLSTNLKFHRNECIGEKRMTILLTTTGQGGVPVHVPWRRVPAARSRSRGHCFGRRARAGRRRPATGSGTHGFHGKCDLDFLMGVPYRQEVYEATDQERSRTRLNQPCFLKKKMFYSFSIVIYGCKAKSCRHTLF